MDNGTPGFVPMPEGWKTELTADDLPDCWLAACSIVNCAAPLDVKACEKMDEEHCKDCPHWGWKHPKLSAQF